MLKKIVIAGFIGLCFGILQPGIAVSQQKNVVPNYKDMANDILKLVNEHRAAMKLNPLVMNDYISKEAGTHSQNMASGKVEFGHDGFDDRAARIKTQLKNVNSWAENVAFGSKTARQAVEMWLKSPGHKKNIEGNYNLTGIGIAKGPDGLYFTQIFAFK